MQEWSALSSAAEDRGTRGWVQPVLKSRERGEKSNIAAVAVSGTRCVHGRGGQGGSLQQPRIPSGCLWEFLRTLGAPVLDQLETRPAEEFGWHNVSCE